MLSPSVHQWLSLVAIIWLQSINGTNSNFPSYSSEFKNLLSLSQLHLNNLAFASDTGKFFGFVSGIAVIYLPFWSVLLLGSLLGLIGYGFQFLFLTYDIPCLSYTHMFILSVLAGNSICWINTVCYVIAIKNFPFDRHVAIGLTSSYFGLSAKIYTTIVDALFSSTDLGKAKAYLFLNSVLPLLISILVIPIIRDVKVDGLTKSTKCGFVSMFFITISTGVYAVISSLVKMRRLVNLVGMALFLLAPWLVPLFFGLCMEKERIKGSDEAGVVDTKGVKEEIGVTLMVKRIDFWLYFSVYLLGASLGLVFLNNLGQIAESRGCPDTSSLVSLSSSFGFFGRLVPSLMDYCFSRSKYMISRPASILASIAPMAGAFFLLLNKTNLSLFIGTAVIGVCTGSITSLSVATTTELFGTTNFGVNHSVVVANIPIGSLLFGYLAAFFYYKEENRLGTIGTCMGFGCYKMTFLVWGSLGCLGTFLALLLYLRTRRFYSNLEKDSMVY